MKKKIIVSISIIFVILAIWISFYFYKEYSNNVHIQIGKDTFRYTFSEAFSGNEWKLYVNDHYVSYVDPFIGYSKKEMRDYLANEQIIKCSYDKDGLRVYSIPSREYYNRCEYIYTFDGLEFYSFSDDIKQYKENPVVKQRLDKLYEKYPMEESKKREEETLE